MLSGLPSAPPSQKSDVGYLVDDRRLPGLPRPSSPVTEGAATKDVLATEALAAAHAAIQTAPLNAAAAATREGCAATSAGSGAAWLGEEPSRREERVERLAEEVRLLVARLEHTTSVLDTTNMRLTNLELQMERVLPVLNRQTNLELQMGVIVQESQELSRVVVQALQEMRDFVTDRCRVLAVGSA